MGKRLTFDEFLIMARAIHGDKYEYPFKIWAGNRSHIDIICPIHGKFSQLGKHHLVGNGCPKCAIISKTYDNDEFIEKAKLAHPNRNYDYSKVEYINNKTFVTIICDVPGHGEFYQRADKHFSGSGCHKCWQENLGAPSLGIDVFLQRAKLFHFLNYDYSKVNFVNTIERVEIICPKHGSFFQSPRHHLIGHGCPLCGQKFGKMENRFLDLLCVPKHCRQIRIPGTRYKVDGLIGNTIYEFDGDFWHGNPKIYDPNELNYMSKKTYGTLYTNTLIRQEKLRSLGYEIVSIWENEFRSLLSYWTEHINQCPSIFTEYLIQE